jgi:arginine decarboxylase
MSKDQTKTDDWSVDSARELYHIGRWGEGYFDINAAGNVVARPRQDKGASVEIKSVIAEALSRDLHPPLLIRFQDILRHRVASINNAFRTAIKECEYEGKYQGVFPIKVNHLREVVEEIIDAGDQFHFGLEVGSKPELMAVMALQDQPGDLIVCNGYKDAKFIRIALMGIQLGKRVLIVIEKLEELKQVIAISRELEVKPMVGIRVRLQSKSHGIWAESGGEHAKFGLTTAELLEAMDFLKSEDLAESFKLLHFHIGSQVPDIQIIKKAVQEAARFYAKVYKLGFQLEYLDVGGGLAIDYDGSRSTKDSSANYTLQEYANDVVYAVGAVCNEERVPHPTIISESGRAIVAHHSMLVVQVFGSVSKTNNNAPVSGDPTDHNLVTELLYIRDHPEKSNPLEALHDAQQFREDARNLFTLGHLDLPDKAKIERLYWEIGASIVARTEGQDHIPEEIVQLRDSMGHQYICNFSVFQSLLDNWALDQLFPVMPLGRHTERPDVATKLVDITCDSDGQIDKFIGLNETGETLALHSLKGGKADEPYYLGFFLMGAYQDIMGDLHNLFGSVSEIHIFLDPEEADGYYVEEVIEGSNIAEALDAVQYDERELKRRMKAQIDAAIKSDRLKSSAGMRMLKEYERGLRDYTYLTF